MSDARSGPPDCRCQCPIPSHATASSMLCHPASFCASCPPPPVFPSSGVDLDSRTASAVNALASQSQTKGCPTNLTSLKSDLTLSTAKPPRRCTPILASLQSDMQERPPSLERPSTETTSVTAANNDRTEAIRQHMDVNARLVPRRRRLPSVRMSRLGSIGSTVAPWLGRQIKPNYL